MEPVPANVQNLAWLWWLVLLAALVGFGGMIALCGTLGFGDILAMFRTLDEEHADTDRGHET